MSPDSLCVCFPWSSTDGVLALPLCPCTCPIWVHLLHPQVPSLRAEGEPGWSYKKTEPPALSTGLYYCWRSSFSPHFSSVVTICGLALYVPRPYSCSVTPLASERALKLFGKLMLNIPQHLLGLLPPESLHLKEAISYSYLGLLDIWFLY